MDATKSLERTRSLTNTNVPKRKSLKDAAFADDDALLSSGGSKRNLKKMSHKDLERLNEELEMKVAELQQQLRNNEPAKPIVANDSRSYTDEDSEFYDLQDKDSNQNIIYGDDEKLEQISEQTTAPEKKSVFFAKSMRKPPEMEVKSSSIQVQVVDGKAVDLDGNLF
jgi:hypothetical protein